MVWRPRVAMWTMARNPMGQHTLYPITLTNLADLLVIVVGGGPVATRKVSKLLDTGAQITVISPQLTPRLQSWVAEERIEWLERGYQSGDLADATLSFVATNVREINAQVADEARSLGILCNVADAPSDGSFHLPATHRQDGLVVAVSSEDGKPKRSMQVRDQIAKALSSAD